MATAQFTVTVRGLTVDFIDQSNGATTWLWDFGGGVGIDDTDESSQNPRVTFPNAGEFVIVLNINDGESEKSHTIYVSNTAGYGFSVQEVIELEFPIGYVPKPIAIEAYTNRWRLMLKDAFIDGDILTEYNFFNEIKWPPLANYLVGKLVVYSFIVQAMAELGIAGGGGSGGGEGGASSSTHSQYLVKRLITGPSEAEFFQFRDEMSSYCGGGAGSGSPFDVYIQSICMLASKLRVHIGLCKARTLPVIPHVKTQATDVDPYIFLNEVYNPTYSTEE